MVEEDLLIKYEPLIFKVAKKFYNVEINDLYQSGCWGLIKAYRKFDQTQGTNFIAFAYKYIFGEMYELANKSRDIKLNKAYLKLYKQIEETKKALTIKNNRVPSMSELCLFLELDECLVAEVISLTEKSLSLDDEFATLTGNTLPISECIGKEDNLDDRILIEDSLNELEPLEQSVIKIRYFNDLTQMETAEVLGISQVKVSRLEQKDKEKIKKYIAA